MVLADDVTGNGMMDLIVSTMNGNIVCLGTDVEYHPMKVRRANSRQRRRYISVHLVSFFGDRVCFGTDVKKHFVETKAH